MSHEALTINNRLIAQTINHVEFISFAKNVCPDNHIPKLSLSSRQLPTRNTIGYFVCVCMCAVEECFCIVVGGSAGATLAPASIKDYLNHRSSIDLGAIWDRPRPASVDYHCRNNPKNNEQLALVKGQDIKRITGAQLKKEEGRAVHHTQDSDSLWIWRRHPCAGHLPIFGRT